MLSSEDVRTSIAVLAVCVWCVHPKQGRVSKLHYSLQSFKLKGCGRRRLPWPDLSFPRAERELQDATRRPRIASTRSFAEELTPQQPQHRFHFLGFFDASANQTKHFISKAAFGELLQPLLEANGHEREASSHRDATTVALTAEANESFRRHLLVSLV